MTIRRPRWVASITLLAAALVLLAGGCSGDDESATDASGQAAAADEAPGYAHPERLVAADWLAERLDDPAVRVIDVRGREDYDAGHIPGAVWLDARSTFQGTDDRGVDGMLPGREVAAAALGEAGVSPDSTVILYDGTRNLWAARALWALEVYGHDDVRLLNGAWDAWVVAGHEVSQDAATVEATDYPVPDSPREDLVAGWEAVLEGSENDSGLMVDTRSPDEYVGRDVRAARGGHIPGAVNVDWVNVLNDRGEFKSAAELRALYEGAGITPDHPLFTMCQTGVRAAHTWFVLTHLLGYENVAVYDGSWIEWGNRDDLPIERS